MLDKGGLKLAHVPYSFKVLSLIEASQLGYENVMWLDCTIHPTNDLSSVFSIIEQKGYFLLRSVMLKYDYDYGILPDDTLDFCQIKPRTLRKIAHITSPIVGLSFKSPITHKLLNYWYQMTSKTLPAMTFYPEEFILSIAGYKAGIKNLTLVGQYLDQKTNTPIKPTHSPDRPFWLDKAQIP